MTLIKDHLAESISRIGSLPTLESKRLMEVLFEIIKQTLADGEDILISGFGKFCVREKKSRMGRNPKIGADLFLDGRSVVTFKCSSVLKEKVNQE